MTWKKLLWSDDAVVVRKNSGANIGTRPRLNFIEGGNITLAISDDAVGDEIDISIALASSLSMTGNLDMNDYLIDDVNDIQAYDNFGIDIKDYLGTTRARLAHQAFGHHMFYWPINMGANKISGLGDPAAAQDAATKAWVEANFDTDRTRNIYISSPHYYTGEATSQGIFLDPDTDEDVWYRFKLPNDYVSTPNLYVDVEALSNDNVVIDVTLYYGTIGEHYTQFNNTDLGNVVDLTANDISRLTTAGLFTNVDGDDIITVKITRDANHASDTCSVDLAILGLEFTYTADM